MKKYYQLIFILIAILGLLWLGINKILQKQLFKDGGRPYQVEINRLAKEIEDGRYDDIKIEEYPSIIKVIKGDNKSGDTEFLEGDGSDYVIRFIDGYLYRIEYRVGREDIYSSVIKIVNLFFIATILVIIIAGVYLGKSILLPFQKLQELPYELAKGNLNIGLKESPNRYFGRFVWGLNLLSNHLEEQKKKELMLQKEKKSVILSISHDIKTPLSAIKLYTKALSRNLYKSEEKRNEVIENIHTKVLEIEGYLTEIIEASSEDFLLLKVEQSEFYLYDLLREINSYYKEKIELLKINWEIEFKENAIIKGDLHRSIEVLQNVIENAIKYGDGKLIEVTISSEENCRLINVRNSGCTLSENEMPHIFNSFWRGSNRGKHTGSGLGLYICKEIMHKMDGDIYAKCCEGEIIVTAVFRLV